MPDTPWHLVQVAVVVFVPQVPEFVPSHQVVLQVPYPVFVGAGVWLP